MSDGRGERSRRFDRRDGLALGLLTLAGGLARALFLAAQQLPAYDPWRHLLLVQRLRDGEGFTLFADQPYLWYSPVWYRLCAAVPEALSPDRLAALFSTLAIPLLYLVARRRLRCDRFGAAIAAGLLALAGPAIGFTCHYGSEGLALFLLLAALWLAAPERDLPSWSGAGLLFGIALVLRLNFLFAGFLVLPALRRPRQAIAFGLAALAPLGATWWRNHRIIAAHDWLFTWDGLATPADGFNALSTLVLQMHPDVGEALRRLHEQIVPRPQWIVGLEGIEWGLIVFMTIGVLAAVACRRVSIALTVGVTLVYFLVFDKTMSSNFFRIYLVVFPAFFLGLALLADDLRVRYGRSGMALALGLAALLIGGGSSLLRPIAAPDLETVSLPRQYLDGPAYLVNSSYYHPESLIYRHPDKRFIGLPLLPDRIEEFLAAYPQYDRVLWHDFSVQPELHDWLVRQRGLRSTTRVNERGHVYEIHERRGDAVTGASSAAR